MLVRYVFGLLIDLITIENSSDVIDVASSHLLDEFSSVSMQCKVIWNNMLIQSCYEVPCSILFCIFVSVVLKYEYLRILLHCTRALSLRDCQDRKVFTDLQYLCEARHHAFVQNDSVCLKGYETVGEWLRHKHFGIFENPMLEIQGEMAFTQCLVEYVEDVWRIVDVFLELCIVSEIKLVDTVSVTLDAEVLFNVFFHWRTILLNYLLIWNANVCFLFLKHGFETFILVD